MRRRAWLLLLCALACGGCDERRCDEHLERREFKEALEACTRAYDRVGGARLAAQLALANVSLRNDEEAYRLASLPEVRDLPAARRVRGVVMRNRGKLDEARRELQAALDAATASGQPKEIANAAFQLAGVAFRDGRFASGLSLLDLSAREAERAGDRSAIGFAALGRADLLNRLGDADRAFEWYARAAELSAPFPADLAYVEHKRGLLHMHLGALPLARMYLQRGLDLAEPRGIATLTDGARLSLARLSAAEGDLAQAERHLAAATEKVQRGTDALRVRSTLALAGGDAEKAVRFAEQSLEAALDLEDRLDSLTPLGRAQAAAGRNAEARRAYEGAIGVVEELGRLQPPFQGWLVSRFREPFDELFALHTKAREHEAALGVVARFAAWESLTFEPATDLDEGSRARDAEKVQRAWEGVRAREPTAPAAMGDREVLALHEAGGHLWVGLEHGQKVEFTDAGGPDSIGPLIGRFLASAADKQAADALGEALWSAAGMRASDAPLYVLATGRLRRLPLAALRHGGRYWAELRPIASVPGLSFPPAARATLEGARWAIADPKGDLPAAREEAAWVAARVGGQVRLGEAARREAVLGARGASLLHLATHARPSVDGTALLLSDGEVSAADVLQRAAAARLVVLASCGSASGRNVAGSDSLATAFLRTGSAAVLGTLRSVGDDAAQEMVRAFYEEGGLADPVRGLARAQRRLALRLPPEAWSAFSMSVSPLYWTPDQP